MKIVALVSGVACSCSCSCSVGDDGDNTAVRFDVQHVWPRLAFELELAIEPAFGLVLVPGLVPGLGPGPGLVLLGIEPAFELELVPGPPRSCSVAFGTVVAVVGSVAAVAVVAVAGPITELVGLVERQSFAELGWCGSWVDDHA